MQLHNPGDLACSVTVVANAYRNDGPWTLTAAPRQQATRTWTLASSSHWYDLTATSDHFEQRFAGRVNTGRHGSSDPAMGTG